MCIIPQKGGILMSAMNEEKKQALQALKTARGQIDGIVKMIEDGRYCIDISNQIFAASAMLKRANLMILKQHMNHCVLEAAEQGHGSEKIDEVIGILSKVLDK
jgi:DNA-binding FrmR family transcriptional regulator